MKTCRVSEAHRKILLYGENWIEPEFLDNKSPFFKDLENELLQNDLTLETAETAFLHYLEKLDTVARLEIVGMYHQLETSNGQATGEPLVDIMHVFGRTHNTPHVYYYRKRIDASYWTAWERIDLDIQGDHLIPVVRNRRLYLFWPIFTEKQEENPVTMPPTGGSIAAGRQYWEIQLAWSEYRSSNWSAKKVTTTHLSPFWITDLARKPQLKLQYIFRLIGNGDTISIWWSDWQKLDEPQGVWAFRFTNCDGEALPYSVTVNKISHPQGTIPEGMTFVEDSPEKSLMLPTGELTDSGSLRDAPVLQLTPGVSPFRILYPHQDGFITGERPFFFQDATRTFFINPSERQIAYGIDRSQIPLEALNHAPEQHRRLLNRLSLEDVSIVDLIRPTAHDSSNPFFGGGKFEGTFGIAYVFPTSPNAGRSKSFTRDIFVKEYLFQPFYHPYVCLFIKELNRNGIDGLLQRRIQVSPHSFLESPQPFNFEGSYAPRPIVLRPYPQEDIDFSYDGAYSLYNWELFFHVPFLIANRLHQNQRFEEAQQWFHYIFNPTDTSGLDTPRRYWQTRPFYETTREDYQTQEIQNLLRLLALGGSDQRRSQLSLEDKKKLEDFEKQVNEWRKNPFKPHLIARLRTTAYQKAIVMKYIDNLIAWGDQLFRRDTIEFINEATQLYILAAEILGRRPEQVPSRATSPVQTYNSLEPILDAFSNASVELEHLIPTSGQNLTAPSTTLPRLTLPTYFCIPKNDKLLKYWDIVADRLFKIRHCMNIRPLA